MKKLIILIIAISFKIVLFCLLLNFSIVAYDKTEPFYYQNIIVWICLYLPLFMGLESIINLIFDRKHNK